MDQTNQSENIATPVAPQADAQAAGKFMTQDEINRIAIANKQRGYEQGQREAQQAPAQPAVNSPAQATVDVDQIVQKHLADAEAKRQQALKQAQDQADAEALKQHVNKTMTELAGKVSSAKQKYSDFDAVTSQAGLQKNPMLAFYANTVPNGGDVMYELGKSPAKLAAFQALAKYPETEDAALLFIKDLSNTISSNDAQAQQAQAKVTKSPIQSIKPSPVNGGKISGSIGYKNYFKGKV